MQQRNQNTRQTHCGWPILLSWIFLCAIALPLSAQKQMKVLKTSLKTVQEVYFTAGPALMLTFQVTNETDKTQKFCKYFTPFEGFKGPFLEVVAEDGTPVAYQGPQVKRGKPQAADYLKVAAGQSIDIDFHLDLAYPLDAGHYIVQFKGRPSFNRLADSNRLSLRIVQREQEK